MTGAEIFFSGDAQNVAPPGDPGVLFIGLSAYGAHGGIQRFNRRIIGALLGLGWHPRPLMLLDDPAILEIGLDTVGLPKNSGKSARGSRARLLGALVQMARGTNVLLLGHINLLPLAIIYRLLRPSGQVVLFAHGIEVWDDPRFRRRKLLEPLLLKLGVDRVASVSRYTRDRMAEAFHVPLDRFEIFPNAVTLIPERARNDRGQTLLAVSRLGTGEREKHVDKLIRAMPQVVSSCPRAKLMIIGDGPLRDEYTYLANSLGISDSVQLLGSVSEDVLHQHYKNAAAFVLPSSKEGFGIVYLEAWLHGLPVIGSKFGAGGEVISDGVDGFTVDPADIPALASRMIELLTNDTLSGNFSKAGRTKVNKYYSDNAFTHRLQSLCNGERVGNQI